MAEIVFECRYDTRSFSIRSENLSESGSGWKCAGTRCYITAASIYHAVICVGGKAGEVQG